MIEAFDIFDKNKDGFISRDELGPVLRALGQNPTQEDVDKIMRKADKNGKISRQEYTDFIRNHMKDPKVVEIELREAFRKFDRNKSGGLDINQLKQALKQLGEPMNDREIQTFLKLGDTNGNGEIDVDGELNLVLI
ncbi:hypothetical protein KUTeg_000747 [Tegillarca granosa]|uniref:EF-hand domain-containing protein n=1 Tax=Tegillarca granosa TaxID=220873 RepID=A0ABQ9FZR4_TEGGR|nr:hypothetical protein KUTeg_000747 [Tegillarca granosa]